MDGITAVAQDVVDQAIGFGFWRVHVAVTREVSFDLLPCFAGVLGDQVEHLYLQAFLLAQGNLHVGRVAARAGAGRAKA